MNVLVTGASGFLGSHLVRALVKEGHKVTAFVRKNSSLDTIKHSMCEICVGDLLEPDSLHSALQGKDAVFHTAAVTQVDKKNKDLFDKVNVGATRKIAELCQKFGVDLIHVSSTVALGISRDASTLITERTWDDLSWAPASVRSKRLSDEYVFEKITAGEVRGLVVNPPLMYGAGDFIKEIRKSNLKILKGELPFYTDGGVNIVAVEDVVTGMLSAWNRKKFSERYILGGDNLTIRDFFNLLAESNGKAGPKRRMPSWALRSVGALVDVFHIDSQMSGANIKTLLGYNWCTSEKAERELGYVHRSAREAIKNSTQWIRSQGLLD